MVFADIVQAGMNNPECSFFVGAFTGQFLVFRYIIMLMFLYFAFKAADKLAFEPMLEWLKNKIERFKKK